MRPTFLSYHNVLFAIAFHYAGIGVFTLLMTTTVFVNFCVSP